MKLFFKLIVNTSLILLLTIVSQIGGVVYFVCLFLFRKKQFGRRNRILSFIVLYLLATFFIVPLVAPKFGRVKIKNEFVHARMPFYILANRNYVDPELHEVLQTVGQEMKAKYPVAGIAYLDANFPFFDGFPLLPHLSHNDGEKIDISFIYENGKGITNQKPSFSGYGVYAGPQKGEIDQISICEQRGSWQYSFSQKLSFGKKKGLILSEKATKDMVNLFVNQQSVGKIFIEPHLKQRLNLTIQKVRYHGCQSVRHDDHIHVQLK